MFSAGAGASDILKLEEHSPEIVPPDFYPTLQSPRREKVIREHRRKTFLEELASLGPGLPCLTDMLPLRRLSPSWLLVGTQA